MLRKTLNAFRGKMNKNELDLKLKGQKKQTW